MEQVGIGVIFLLSRSSRNRQHIKRVGEGRSALDRPSAGRIRAASDKHCILNYCRVSGCFQAGKNSLDNTFHAADIQRDNRIFSAVSGRCAVGFIVFRPQGPCLPGRGRLCRIQCLFDNCQHRTVRSRHDRKSAKLAGQLFIVIDLGDDDSQSSGGTVLQQNVKVVGQADAYHAGRDVDCAGGVGGKLAGQRPGSFRGNDKTIRAMNSGVMTQFRQADKIDTYQRLKLPADVAEREYRWTGQGAGIAGDDIVENGADFLVTIVQRDIGVPGERIEVIGYVMDMGGDGSDSVFQKGFIVNILAAEGLFHPGHIGQDGII